MNQKIILIESKTGFIVSLIEYTESNFVDGDFLDGNIIKVVESFPENVGDFIKENFLSLDGIFKQLPEKPSIYHLFNRYLEQWQEPEGLLDTLKADGIKQINQLAGQKITAIYPITKQNFLQGRYIELMMLGQTDSDEAKAIADGWRFIKTVKDASDEANIKINQSETLEAITAIVDEFKLFNT